MIFWKILLAHALTDFVFQPNSWAENKAKITVLLVHTLIFFLLSVVILLPNISWQVVAALVCLAVFHGFIDTLKNRVQKGTARTHWLFFLGDQALHVLGILGVVFFLDRERFLAWINLLSTCWSDPSLFLFVSFFVVIVFGGGFFTAVLCKGFLVSLELGEEARD